MHNFLNRTQSSWEKGSTGMLDDIWDTPEVFRRVLEELVPSCSKDDFTPPPRSPNSEMPPRRVKLPTLSSPLPQSHGLSGKTPLDVLSACHGRESQNRVVIVGSGTSYHAALTAEYMIETIARIPVEVQLACEFRHKAQMLKKGDTLIVVSGSGETTDSVECVRSLRGSSTGNDVLVISVVNEDDCTLKRESDATINVLAGEEKGLTSTKVFSATILSFFLFSVALGEACQKIEPEEMSRLMESLEALPNLVQLVLDREASNLRTNPGQLQTGDCKLWEIGCQNVMARNFIFLGRGLNFPMALEGAMKCKELAYIHAEGYPAAEMKHGPIALIDQFMPVVVIAPKSDPTYDKIKSNIEEVNARSGSVIAITEDSNNELESLSEYVIHVPETHEYLAPMVVVIPLQLLAYMMGILRGNKVDNPRGIVKSVREGFMMAASP
eukprot:CAMPEP_0206500594 /NCGR_PEP_ID=MMETSP0324_2-20121206/52648_1 /ASSEMBLY_ACC=CAM_ASM_000836 /TAXON_ID=2866 /ORGANISM="Crypthecodinium cohnii, Strain Seligo" /LENGTH=438 /DNA_ID=CAMNT_0053987933 /DNA_START=57 /DNA_END=1373 /DNA_ORIENTATION=+